MPSLGLGLGTNRINPLFRGLLNQYSGAAAAYSLEKLSSGTNNVVRVRRSSDDSESDFTAQQVSSGTLTTWVNTEVVQHASDFSSTTDGWTGNAATLAANIDGIGGQDDNLRVTVNTATTGHRAEYPALGTDTFTISADVYIPSTNTDVDGVGILVGGVGLTKQTSTTDTWVTISKTETGSASANVRIQAYKGESFVFTGNGTDVYYIRNVTITQTTADGFVTTWYDQSGSGNDASQATAASQPKIVDAGSLVTGGLDFDGTDDYMDATGASSADGSADTTVIVGQVDVTNVTGIFLDAVDSASAHTILNNTAGDFRAFFGSTTDTIYSTPSNTSQNLHFVFKSNVSANSMGYVNGVGDSLNAGTQGFAGGLRIGKGRGVLTDYLNGKIAEIIVYHSDQSANRAGIEANINGRYSIY